MCLGIPVTSETMGTRSIGMLPRRRHLQIDWLLMPSWRARAVLPPARSIIFDTGRGLLMRCIVALGYSTFNPRQNSGYHLGLILCTA